MSFAAAQDLPIAPARRAAIFEALLKAADSDERARRLRDTSRSCFVDDLCELSVLADCFDVSDLALAGAAAEEGAAVSVVSRILYAARRTLRAAGFAFTGPSNGVAVDHVSTGVPDQRSSQTVHCPNLGAAFEALRQAGATRVRVARQLLEALSGTDTQARRGDQTASIAGAVSRLLIAAYADDIRLLIPAACGAPYFIDSAQLQFALASVNAEPVSMPTRHALAAAVSTLPGIAAKEAALAALAALDAALHEGQAAHPSLVAAARAVESHVVGHAGTNQMKENDPERACLLRAAESADRVWAASPEFSLSGARIANVLEGLRTTRIDATLELHAGACEDATPSGRLEFADRSAMALGWETFAGALDIPRDARERLARPAPLSVVVDAPLANAAAEFGLEKERSEARRVWPLAEAPSLIKVPTMTFSASRLNAYVKCPRRWFYDYLCEALEDPGSLHAAYGKVVHEALEALHRQVRVPSRHDPAIILERFLQDLDAAFGRARSEFFSQLEYEVSRMRARRMAEQYVRWLAQESSRAPMEVLHVELLQRGRFGEYDFIGYIDRIDRPLSGGPVTIFDYKTGRVDADAAEYLEKVRRGDEAQLALYYAMRRAEGDEIARIALVSIRDPREDAWILALDIVEDGTTPVVDQHAHDGVLRATCSRADLESSLAALIARCDLLTKQGVEHFPAGEDPPCNFCAYAISCRERPADEERIFAR
ncbi:MAG TPA: PD-(D/E)XK nuclease family protein [Candidatus Acidoferrales bacterium]|nr:PD-(D/E)XK nuclease family protein [Candidatus Acidoferrales bacterium]